MFAAPGGLIWVGTSVPGDSSSVLVAVTTSGRLVGTVTIPTDFRVLEIGRDYLLGAYAAGPGLDRLVMYRLGTTSTRPTAARRGAPPTSTEAPTRGPRPPPA
jgi:hypothetical protein